MVQIMGSSTRADDPGMVWLRFSEEDAAKLRTQLEVEQRPNDEIDLEAIFQELEKAVIGKIEKQPSAVTGSPYQYVYVYLTDKEHEGPHLIVSAAGEYGEKGILVGKYPHYEEPATYSATVFYVEDAVEWCRRHA